MAVLAWLLVGVLAGALARATMPADDEGGIIVTLMLGMAGAIIGGFVALGIGIGGAPDNFDVGSAASAALGAAILLIAYRSLTGGRGVRV